MRDAPAGTHGGDAPRERRLSVPITFYSRVMVLRCENAKDKYPLTETQRISRWLFPVCSMSNILDLGGTALTAEYEP